MIVLCDCGAKLKIDEAKIAGRRVKIRCPRCGNVLSVNHHSSTLPTPVATEEDQPHPSPAGALVLIAHDSEIVRCMVSDVLTAAGFRVELVSNGVDALKKANELKPRGLVLDVGLSGIYSFELCEHLRESPITKEIKIVLLSSVYDRKRYKRTPISLYGADDYIEKHHIPDLLPVKLNELLSLRTWGGKPLEPTGPQNDDLPEKSHTAAREYKPSLLIHGTKSTRSPNVNELAPNHAVASMTGHRDDSETTEVLPVYLNVDASIFQKEECDIPGAEEGNPDAIEKARRFARIIVSDIALYNQEAVIEGIRNGNFFELLEKDIEEGRELYVKRIPEAIRTKKDYYQEAFDSFIGAAKNKNVR